MKTPEIRRKREGSEIHIKQKRMEDYGVKIHTPALPGIIRTLRMRAKGVGMK